MNRCRLSIPFSSPRIHSHRRSVTLDPNLALSFSHAAYIDTLPPPSSLWTPLHWSPSELELARGTNLYHAITSRLGNLQAEHTSALEIMKAAGAASEVCDRLTWLVFFSAIVLPIPNTDMNDAKASLLVRKYAPLCTGVPLYPSFANSFTCNHGRLVPCAPPRYRCRKSCSWGACVLGYIILPVHPR
jgi:hypothetical protein